MTTKLVTSNYKLITFQNLINDIDQNNYYLFVGNHDVANTTVPDVYNRESDILVDSYRNMIMGKKIANNNVKLVIRNIPYETNTKYDMYDDADETMFDKDYYAIVSEGEFFHVYKCLDNNFESNSTVTPTFSHITGSNTEVYETSDGYRWKYMYSVSDLIEDTFASSEYFPITANDSVSNSAVDGALDIIKIENDGRGYDNYIDGTFASDDIRVNGNNSLYKVTTVGASVVNGFYTDCLLYITAGDGVGDYRVISDYISNGNGNFIVLQTALTTPTNGSQYEIFPRVEISGSGEQTINAVARAIVNSSSGNSITKIEFIERGAGYRYATAKVQANSVVDIDEEADLRVIIPPYGGHGANAYQELDVKTIGIGLSLSNSESNTILTTNGFKQLGILKNPLFANVVVEFSNTSDVFFNGETIYKVSPKMIAVEATMNTTSHLVMSPAADFANQVSAGDLLYIKGSNGTVQFLAYVNNAPNSSYLYLTSNSQIDDTDASIFIANVTTSGVISDIPSTNTVVINNVNGAIGTDDVLIGATSGTIGTVNTITRNDVTKAFNTFVQAHKYVGTVDTGTFVPNEYVYIIDITSSNALLHSVVNNGVNVEVYTTRQSNVFSVGDEIIGNTSDAVFSIQTAYSPELVPGSGEVLYIENRSAINRANNLTEKFKLYF